MRKRTALLIALCALGGFHTPAAAIPQPCNATIPCGITLVSADAAGVAIPGGEFSITIRDLANNPAPGVLVKLDFGPCVDVSICSVQVTAGVLVNCTGGNRTVTMLTNASGTVRMSLVGGVVWGASPSTMGCMKAYADGQLLSDGLCYPSAIQVSAFDETGDDGIGPADLALWLKDFFTDYRARSDYDYSVLCRQDVGVADLSRWLAAFFAGGARGCASLGGTLCP